MQVNVKCWYVCLCCMFVSVLLREAFSLPYNSFFHLLVNDFSVTSFRTFFDDPFPSLYWWAVTVVSGTQTFSGGKGRSGH